MTSKYFYEVTFIGPNGEYHSTHVTAENEQEAIEQVQAEVVAGCYRFTAKRISGAVKIGHPQVS